MLEETANLKDTCIRVTVQCHPDLEALKKLKKKKTKPVHFNNYLS